MERRRMIPTLSSIHTMYGKEVYDKTIEAYHKLANQLENTKKKVNDDTASVAINTTEFSKSCLEEAKALGTYPEMIGYIAGALNSAILGEYLLLQMVSEALNPVSILRARLSQLKEAMEKSMDIPNPDDPLDATNLQKMMEEASEHNCDECPEDIKATCKSLNKQDPLAN